MTYQDQKLKAIARLSIMSAVLTVLLLVNLIYPALRCRPFADTGCLRSRLCAR